MKILFAPSENKSDLANFKPINENSFIFKDLFPKRFEIIKKYNDFIQKANLEQLSSFFQLKNDKEILKFKTDLLKLNSCKAIQRYTGVAFEYLNFKDLNQEAQAYILKNTVIFSNLFGPILAADLIPNYKFKQGAKFQNLDLAKFYKQHFTKSLDEFLKDEELIDLRAGFYEKFYTIKQNFSTYKFLKQGKIISHFAKAYRGILLRTLALFQCKNNEELLEYLPSNLKVLEIKRQAFKQEIILEILEE